MAVGEAPSEKQRMRERVDLSGSVTYQRHVRLVDVATACGYRESRHLYPLMTRLSITARSLPGTTGKWLSVVDAQRLLTTSQETPMHGSNERRDPVAKAAPVERRSEVIHDRIEERRIRIAAYLLRKVAIIDIARVEGIGRRTVTRDVRAIRHEWDLFRTLGREEFTEALHVAHRLQLLPLLRRSSPFHADLLAACFKIAEGQRQIKDVARDMARFQAQLWPGEGKTLEVEQEVGVRST